MNRPNLPTQREHPVSVRVLRPFTMRRESGDDMTESALDPSQSDWLSAVESEGRTVAFPAKAIIIQEGDEGDTLYVIKSGRGKIFSSNGAGKEIVFATFGPGDTLGEPSLDGGPRSASVMTSEPTTCVIVPIRAVKLLMADHPRLALQVVNNLIRLLRASNENLKSVALEDVYGRVMHLLMKSAVPNGAGWIVEERLTHQAIADRVGSSREMVSRILKGVEQGGYLTFEKERIVIHRKPPPGW